MEILNVAGLILGIISSAISIYVFFIDRPRRKAQQTGHPASAPSRPPRPEASASTAPPPAPASGQSAPAAGGVTLSKIGAVIWGVLGFLCLSEGTTFGEPFLLLLGGGFLWLAYKMWKK